MTQSAHVWDRLNAEAAMLNTADGPIPIPTASSARRTPSPAAAAVHAFGISDSPSDRAR